MEKLLCPHCKQEKSNSRFKTHVFKCKLRYEKYPVNDMILDYKLGLSLPELSEKYGFSVGAIYRVFTSVGFATRSVKESDNDVKKNKRKKTLYARYGVKHNFERGVLRDSWEKRLLEEEGIVNVFQRGSVKEKIKQTLLYRYGVEHPMLIEGINDVITKRHLIKWGVTHPMLLPEIRNKQKLNTKYVKLTKIHKTVNDCLIENNFKTQTEFELCDYENNKTYFYDIILVGTNKLIEVNGDYWHFNPKIYKSGDIVRVPGNHFFMVDIKWDYDRKKIEFAKTENYDVLVIWEEDLKNNKEETLNKIINYAKN